MQKVNKGQKQRLKQRRTLNVNKPKSRKYESQKYKIVSTVKVKSTFKKMETLVKSQLVTLSQNSQDDVNFVPWRLKLNLVLKTKKLYEYVTGAKVRPAGAADDAELVEWTEKDLVLEAQQLIALNVSDDISYKTIHCMTAKQMMDNLVTLYGTKTEQTMEILRR